MKMNFYVNKSDININNYYIATYDIESTTNLNDAAWNIAIGQSVGNPNVRNSYETEELFKKHSCLILADNNELLTKHSGTVEIAFPVCNTDFASDGINHLLCQLMGGHTDINIIKSCRLVKLELPKSVTKHFHGPKFGIKGIRELTNQYNKPLLGSIIKPKIGLKPKLIVDIVSQLVDGGVNFIKEDEIMVNPNIAPLEKRVELISNYLSKNNIKIIYCHTINCDPHVLVDRVTKVSELGGNGVHINILSGLGCYNSIRKLDLNLFLHFQSSGSKIFTTGRYSIAWTVICQLASLMGADTIQTGMIGGYSNDDTNEILECIKILHKGNTLPALSCGMHPGLIEYVSNIVGNDYLANAGGSIHGHPYGTLSGASAMRQAIDKKYSEEYYVAIERWGKV